MLALTRVGGTEEHDPSHQPAIEALLSGVLQAPRDELVAEGREAVVALKKSDLYSSLWASCDQLRGGMDASQYKDYILTLLFMKYVSDKAKSDPDSLIDVPEGGSFDDMFAAKGDKEIGDRFNKIIGKLADANGLRNVIDQADFNDSEKLGSGKEIQDRLSKLVTIFKDLDFRGSRAEGDDLLGDAYEYLMRHFATESGKSKGQFYTPAEVSRVLVKVVGINSKTHQYETVYDPACGSGSLLLKAAAEAPRGMTIYGQEKDNATWALSKMNMILHGNETAEIYKGDTITNPQLTEGTRVKTFDYVVMNPPFSIKSWRNGLEQDYGRFEYGMPPEKNGDYAFLLHALASLKSTGKAAVILPHGVLFRGNAEGNIRRELLKRGFIKGVIGLPANLFYGTGIPACIVLLDKENAVSRSGVFMVDASRGFTKDGNKNRLRDQDIHKIVDTFNRQVEIDGYARMVPMSEIADPKNNYNLNIPRYIDSSEPEDLQDLSAHLYGGIPNRDIDALQHYWDALPALKDALIEPLREGYSKLKVDLAEVQDYALNRSGLEFIRADVEKIVKTWFAAHRATLFAIDANTKPNDLIRTLGDDLLEQFKAMPLLDEYDVYQQLMGYWNEVMHDDVFLIMTELGNGGTWASAAKPRKTIEDKERKLSEDPDLEIGAGRSKTKYKMDLVPPTLIVGRYFVDEQARVDELNTKLESASAAVVEHAEEHGVDDALLAQATNDKGAYNKQLVNAAIREARASGDQETLECASAALEFVNREAAAKKAAKEAQAALDAATLRKYGELTDDDVKSIVLDDKWHATVGTRIDGKVDALTLVLVDRIQKLGERYAATLGHLDSEVAKLEAQVRSHLAAMGVH
ncbi:type I restriction-modification system subunit M [Curtobacterium sp. MCBD17_028]|uniref:type I restriction-modification system subunit M n=1 Tax=Curtobacterium sp. MCBD17_028 TaxID=2175670 RepID=UPI0021AC8F24|nr:type I restriction-modification system subunit M [Curtobacterium sp. MCBD17_028]